MKILCWLFHSWNYNRKPNTYDYLIPAGIYPDSPKRTCCRCGEVQFLNKEDWIVKNEG